MAEEVKQTAKKEDMKAEGMEPLTGVIPASATPAAAAPAASAAKPFAGQPRRQGGNNRDRGGDRRNPRRQRSEGKVRPEFDQKIIDIRRVARVVAGGRRFNFSVSIVIGDHKGSVGVGLGKGGDTALAIEKSLRNAKKNLIKIPVTKTMSIPYEVSAKFGASKVTIKPAPGRGVVAGSSVRSVIELAGLKDVGAKLRSSPKNRLNNARVALVALKKLTPHRRALMAAAKNAAKNIQGAEKVAA
jgi:small subunit ribosomal protein S5